MLQVIEYFAKSLKVTQDHSRLLKLVAFKSLGTVSYLHSIVTMALSILYHLRDKAIYWSKIAIFSYPFAFDAPLGGPHWNIAIPFGVQKN